MCATRTGGREPGQWKGSHPARQSPQVWLAKVEGPDCMSSDSQQDLKSQMLKVNSSALESGEGERTPGGRVVEPQKTELSLGGEGNKDPGQCHLPLPSPSQNSKGNQFPSRNLLAPGKHPTLCFCGSIPPMGHPLLVLWGLSHRGPPQQRERSLPMLPLCTLWIHPG